MIEPTLYIIMRSDIACMNPGKAIAQGSHATSDFHQWIDTIKSQRDRYGELLDQYETWREDRSFGRVLVLEATFDQLADVVSKNDFAGMTLDPTYPYHNHYGDVFLAEEITCGWCFICDETTPSELLTQLKLHR